MSFCSGGGVSASVHAGIPSPTPRSRHLPQQTAPIPPEQTSPAAHPPRTRHPQGLSTPNPGTKYNPLGLSTPPPRKQTLAYGQRAASTHPTGMHTCFTLKSIVNESHPPPPPWADTTENFISLAGGNNLEPSHTY